MFVRIKGRPYSLVLRIYKICHAANLSQNNHGPCDNPETKPHARFIDNVSWLGDIAFVLELLGRGFYFHSGQIFSGAYNSCPEGLAFTLPAFLLSPLSGQLGPYVLSSLYKSS